MRTSPIGHCISSCPERWTRLRGKPAASFATWKENLRPLSIRRRAKRLPHVAGHQPPGETPHDQTVIVNFRAANEIGQEE
jgi:hypothetical protein